MMARMAGRELGRRVVEVGCGVGNFTGTLLGREAVIAVDHDAECVARVRERFAGSANLHVVEGDASDDAFVELAGYGADSCVCLNVLEHIADDVRALRKTRLISLDEMRKQKPLAKMVTLRPGNRLSITPVTEAEWKHIQKLL